MGKAYIICREKSHIDEEKICREYAEVRGMTVAECFNVSNAKDLHEALYQFIHDKSAETLIIYSARVITQKPEILTTIFRVLLEHGKTIITYSQCTLTPYGDAYILLQMLRTLKDEE